MAGPFDNLVKALGLPAHFLDSLSPAFLYQQFPPQQDPTPPMQQTNPMGGGMNPAQAPPFPSPFNPGPPSPMGIPQGMPGGIGMPPQMGASMMPPGGMQPPMMGGQGGMPPALLLMLLQALQQEEGMQGPPGITPSPNPLAQALPRLPMAPPIPRPPMPFPPMGR